MTLDDVRRLLKNYDDGLCTEHEVLALLQDRLIQPHMNHVLDEGVEWSGTCGSYCGPKPLPPRRAIITLYASLMAFRRVDNPDVRTDMTTLPMDREWLFDEFLDTDGFLKDAEKLAAKLREHRDRLVGKLQEMWDRSAPYVVVTATDGTTRVIQR